MRIRRRRDRLAPAKNCLTSGQGRNKFVLPADSASVSSPTNHTATRIHAAEYTAIIKPKSDRASARTLPGVLLVLQPVLVEDPDQVFSFSSWRFLRESFRVFGLASAKELDTADVRLSTGKQPYMLSKRRWEAPLIEALYENCDQP
jgi:hypothetical protein